MEHLQPFFLSTTVVLRFLSRLFQKSASFDMYMSIIVEKNILGSSWKEK